MEPHKTASKPARLCSTSAACAFVAASYLEHFGARDPSGYGKSEFVTNARRSGIEYITAEDARAADQERDPEWKPSPPADNDQTGKTR